MAGLLITAAVTYLNPFSDDFPQEALESQTYKIAISSDGAVRLESKPRRRPK